MKRKFDLNKYKILLGKMLRSFGIWIRNLKIDKFKHIITILIAVVLIFAIPIIFGTMGNGSYEKINQDDKNKAINKFSVLKGELLDIDTSTVKVFTSDKGLQSMPLEDYVMGVVSTELPLAFEKEAMIAQGVLARTYVVSKMITPCSIARDHGGVICDTVHCQVYKPMSERVSSMGSESEKFKKKVQDAVLKTENEVLTYEGLLVRYPQYFALSSGRTENGSDVFKTDAEYLKSVASTWDEDLPNYKSEEEFSKDEFIKIINAKYPGSNLKVDSLEKNIKIVSRTEGGSVENIRLGDISIKGTEFRMLFGVRSANFELTFGEKVKIECKGYGHGVGMSQWGANTMAENGEDFEDILKHYYTGVEITNIENTRVE